MRKTSMQAPWYSLQASMGLAGGVAFHFLVSFVRMCSGAASLVDDDGIITAENAQAYFQKAWNVTTEDGVYWPQMLFDEHHPVGTASRLDVHEVCLVDKEGRMCEACPVEQCAQILCRLTVYWSAILVTDGYTTLQVNMDCEGGIDSVVLDTNGSTTGSWSAASSKAQ